MPTHLTLTAVPHANPRPVTSPADAYHRAVALGVRFSPTAGQLGFAFPTTVKCEHLAESEVVGKFIRSRTVEVLAVAARNPAPPANPTPHHHTGELRKQATPPRKVGYGLDGKPLPVPDAPPPPEQPHFTTRPTLAPVETLTAAEVQQETRSIDTEYTFLRDRIAALPEEAEGEPREVQAERERVWGRVGFLQRRAQELEARRQAEMWDRIDKAERDRRIAADGGPRMVTAWDVSPRSA